MTAWEITVGLQEINEIKRAGDYDTVKMSQRSQLPILFIYRKASQISFKYR